MPAPDTAGGPGNGSAVTGPTAATRWWTLGIVTLATFMLALDLTVVNVALPSLRRSLDASFSDLQWVIDAYALTLAVFLLTGGSLADRLGRKRVYTAGFFVFTVASLLCGLAWDTLSLNLARGVQGFGAAVLFAVGPALIGQEFHGKERGVAFGVFGGGVGLALALGPLIGGALTDGLGWRWIFLVNVPVGVIAMGLGVLRIRESRDPRAHGVDWGGLATFSAGLALLVLGLLRGEADGWTSAPILALFVGAAVFLVAFVMVELPRGSNAMLDLSLVRIPTFNAISIIAALMTATAMPAIFLMTLYIQNVLGYSPWDTGLRLLPLMGVLFVAAGIGGSLTAKVPYRVIIGLGAAFLAAGLAMIEPSLDIDGSWTDLLPSMILMGIGIGMYNPARASISIAVVEPRKAGMASGINETFQQAGWALGVAAFGAFFQSRTSENFAGSGAARQMGSAAEQLSDVVAAGNVQEAVASAPAGLSDQVGQAAHAAFLAGLSDVAPVIAAVAGVAALIGFVFIRVKDLDPSALGPPGVLPEVEEDPAEYIGEDAPKPASALG